MRNLVLRRPAALIFTARYLPFARITVNLSVGAARLPLVRYLPLAGAAGLGWALHQVGIGTFVGMLLRDSPVLAVIITIALAIGLGVAVDPARRRDPDVARTPSSEAGVDSLSCKL